jgi:hypothetical protein
MNRRVSVVAASCMVFMCGNAARADIIPFDPADLKKEQSREQAKEQQKNEQAKEKSEPKKDKSAEKK